MNLFKKAAVMSSVLTLSSGLALAASPPPLYDQKGVFPDHQEWQITVPVGWNGVVINDLDRMTSASRATFFLSRGYAYTGTKRHPDRDTNWDQNAETANNAEVVKMFAALFGKPKRVIQFGCSGGGSTGLSEAEKHPELFDGVVAGHASNTITNANMRFDLTFALKALLDTGDVLPLIVEDPLLMPAAQASWKAFLLAAKETPAGRARMALALVLAQYPVWGSYNQPPAEKVDRNNPAAVQEALLRAVIDGADRAVQGRLQSNLSAHGMVSWNTGIDYTKFYTNADPRHQQIVRDMYAQAGPRAEQAIKADLDRINATARINGSQDAVNYFRASTRDGNIAIPVLHFSSIGDVGTPVNQMSAYRDSVHRKGKESLYRQAFYDAAGHCTFNNAEMAAMVATMEKRIETGRWDNIATSSEMNAVGSSLGLGESRFIEPGVAAGWSEPNTLNRAFYSDSAGPPAQPIPQPPPFGPFR